MKRIGMLAAVMMVMALTGRAAEYYVASDGSDGNGGTNWTDALATIGAGVGKATGAGPHTVYVSNGTYTIASEIALTNTILVRSWNNGALDEVGTIVDGDHKTRCFRLTHAGAALAGFTVRNGTNATTGGGVYITGGGMVSNCLVTACSASDGGGLCVSNGGLVTHSTLSENVAVSNMGAISRGGGVFLDRFGVASNCLVTANTVDSKSITNRVPIYYLYSSGAGIGIYTYAAGDVCRVYGSLVSNNVSELDGGGICGYNYAGGLTQVVISESTVADNWAKRDGGGMFSIRLAGLAGLATDCVIERNRADRYVGGMGGYNACMEARTCVIRGNTATNDGGGAYNLNLFDSLVENNRTSNNGAGIYNGSSTRVVSNCVIRGNSSTKSGGGICLIGSSGYTATVANCEIYDNMAQYGGGASWSVANTNPPQSGLMAGCLLYNNVATNQGGGAYISGYQFCFSACTIVSNYAFLSGGGLYFNRGYVTPIFYSCAPDSRLNPRIS